MPTRDSGDWRWLLRAGSGVAVLLAGLVVLSVGGAGLLTGLFRGAGAPAGTAQTAAFAIAALAPPVVLFFATRSVTDEPTPRKMAGGGAALASASAIASALGGGLTSVAAGSALANLLAIGYAIGSLVAVGGLLGGVTARDYSHGARASGVSWQATDRSVTRSHSRSGAAPADGGSTDSELSFPLDPDSEEGDEDEVN